MYFSQKQVDCGMMLILGLSLQRQTAYPRGKRFEMEIKMQAVIAVTGKDYVGIIADVSQACKRFQVNISDVSQTVLKDYFVMIMLVDLKDLQAPFSEFSDAMKELGKERGLVIHTMHEDIFNSMHRI